MAGVHRGGAGAPRGRERRRARAAPLRAPPAGPRCGLAARGGPAPNRGGARGRGARAACAARPLGMGGIFSRGSGARGPGCGHGRGPGLQPGLAPGLGPDPPCAAGRAAPQQWRASRAGRPLAIAAAEPDGDQKTEGPETGRQISRQSGKGVLRPLGAAPRARAPARTPATPVGAAAGRARARGAQPKNKKTARAGPSAVPWAGSARRGAARALSLLRPTRLNLPRCCACWELAPWNGQAGQFSPFALVLCVCGNVEFASGRGRRRRRGGARAPARAPPARARPGCTLQMGRPPLCKLARRRAAAALRGALSL
jgi:hypothetical protein